MSHTVVIVGAGGVGSVVAHKCAQNPETFGNIHLASRTKSKCDAIAASVAQRFQQQIHTHELDAEDVPATVALLKEIQPSVLINVALPYQDLVLMDACLQAGVHYLDTANYEPKDEAKFEYHWQWAYQQRFQQAGLSALLGSGFDPGVTNMFTAWMLKHHFDSIEYLDIIDVNAGDHGQAFATNFNPEINIREVTANCRHWENEQFVETPPMSVSQQFVCPEEVGEVTIYRLYHEELESLTKHIPGIVRAQFWMSFSPQYIQHLQVLENVGMTRIDPVEYQGQEIIPLQFLKAVLPDPGDLGKTTQGQTCIGCIVRGKKDGVEKAMYVYNICRHEDCFAEVGSQGVSYTTGVPAMIGAKLMLADLEAQQAWCRQGVWNMEQHNPDPFMADLAEQGLPWTAVEIPLDSPWIPINAAIE